MTLTENESTGPSGAYDPWDPAVLEDPYPHFAWLREHAPVYHVAEHDIWVVSRYADLVSAARNVEVFSSNQGNSYERRPVPMLVGLDPPEHTRVRRLVARHWTPRAIDRLRPRIERLVDQILDRALGDTPAGGVAAVDGLVDICEPLPVTLIAEIMGIPTEDWADFRRWSDATVDQMAGPPTEENELQIVEFALYFVELVTRRQAEFDAGTADIDDPNDMVGILFGRTPDGDRLSAEEIVSMCVLLVVAGNETTTNLMANMLVELAQRPEIWDAVAQDRSLLAPLVEESIRFLSPVQGLFRNTLVETELGGVTIPADAKVFLCYALGQPRHHPVARCRRDPPRPLPRRPQRRGSRRVRPRDPPLSRGTSGPAGSGDHVRRAPRSGGAGRGHRSDRAGHEPLDPRYQVPAGRAHAAVIRRAERPGPANDRRRTCASASTARAVS